MDQISKDRPYLSKSFLRSGERRGEFKKTGSCVCDKGVKSEFLHFVQCTKKNRDIL